MTGSLQIKNDIYYAVINLNKNGKKNQKWISTGFHTKGNKRKAEQFLNDMLREYENKHGNSTDVLFSDYVRQWLSYVCNRVDLVTFQGYEIIAKTRVIPYFDEKAVKLIDVDKVVLQKYFDDEISKGKLDGSGALSASSLKHFKNIINQTLNHAVKNDLISSNPCSFVELPKVQKYDSKYYNAEQLKTLFKAIKDDELENLIKITTLYGLRRSEVLGIRWSSIDFESRRLTINHTISKVTSIVSKDKTKNQSSHRSFILSDEAIDIFKGIKENEKQNMSLFGKDYQVNDYVFKWSNGKPYSPDYITRHFTRILSKNDLPKIRFHELRHSCASLLMNNGFTLKDVSEYMGHSDIQITADIYGHLDTSRKESLSKEIEKNIF